MWICCYNKTAKSWIFTRTLSNYDNLHYSRPHCCLSEEAAAEVGEVGWSSLFYTLEIVLHFLPSLFPPFLYFFILFSPRILPPSSRLKSIVLTERRSRIPEWEWPLVLWSWQQCWSNLPGQAWCFHLLSLGAPCVWCELSPGITAAFFSTNLALE